MYLITIPKVRLNKYVSGSWNARAILSIDNFVYFKDSVGINFTYYREEIENEGLENEKISYKEVFKTSTSFLKKEADEIALVIEPLIPTSVESSFDFERMKYYLGAKGLMVKYLNIENPDLTNNDIDFKMEEIVM